MEAGLTPLTPTSLLDLGSQVGISLEHLQGLVAVIAVRGETLIKEPGGCLSPDDALPRASG